MSNRRGNQYLARPSSQPRPRAPALSPPPTNPGSNLRSTQQRTVDNLQHSGPRNHTLVPVYVYPEHLAAVQQFLLALGQPLILDPARHDEPPAQLEEVDAPVSPLSELQGAGDFDGGYSPDKSFEHELSMTSSLSRVSLSSSYVSSTPSNSGSTHRSRLFTSNSSSRTSPNPAARHSRMESLPINTVPSSAHQAASQNQNLKYYCVTIGKKTGIFWDEWHNVESLVKKVSGSRYKSFSTHAQAFAHYSEAKKNGRVEVIRNPGDDEIYGPRSEAEQ